MVQTIFTKSHIRKAFLALGPVSFIAGVSMTIGGILYENAAVAMAGYIVMLVSTILFSIPNHGRDLGLADHNIGRSLWRS